ncbi:MAG: 2'-5' RNA ligase family protein [Bryobacteraceae bacterium]|nr:2'-5' RNA ligase family protein [Bryobacteraceae bacterium]MCX7605063.1 2'-5' RNA ligase family protein [Bryobacteraceae bacterium]
MEPSTGGHQSGRSLTGFYAVVAYIAEPLGSFLNQLRAELVPGCTLRSHLTILPPRRLTAPQEVLSAELDRLAARKTAFEVTLGDIETFDSTGVIYVSLAAGREQVEQLHADLNHGVLFAEDQFPFHPHVTVAQNLGVLPFDEVLARARRRWQECGLPRQFTVSELTLVRNADPGCWEDLSRHSLAPLSLLRTA